VHVRQYGLARFVSTERRRDGFAHVDPNDGRAVAGAE
jgi:hypothetical protein